MLKIASFLVVVVTICGCNSANEFDAKNAAKDYCDCLKRNNVSKNKKEARMICESEQVLKNRYFRAFYIEAIYGNYLPQFPRTFTDSVANFHLEFANALRDNCCNDAFENCKTDSLR